MNQLLIGGRHGGVDDTFNRSITNIEYLAAREVGIPIYAFVQRRETGMPPCDAAAR